MNSVMMVSAFSRSRSMTLKAPQNLPNRSRMSRAWPTPETAPSPEDHFLVHIEHRNKQHQRPQQRGAVVLSGLRISSKCPGVVVTDHDDEPRTEDREKRLQPRLPADARPMVAVEDGAESSVDVPNMRVVEHGAPLDRSDKLADRLIDDRHGAVLGLLSFSKGSDCRGMAWAASQRCPVRRRDVTFRSRSPLGRRQRDAKAQRGGREGLRSPAPRRRTDA
jgi:hypothetical protein